MMGYYYNFKVGENIYCSIQRVNNTGKAATVTIVGSGEMFPYGSIHYTGVNYYMIDTDDPDIDIETAQIFSNRPYYWLKYGPAAWEYTSLVFPSGITNIGRSFLGWAAGEPYDYTKHTLFNVLQQITIPSSVTRIEDYALACGNDPMQVYRPYPNTPSAPTNTFSITINSTNIDYIGDYAFGLCLMDDLDFHGASISHIGRDAFYNCCYLETIEMADINYNLPEACFYGCASLKKFSTNNYVHGFTRQYNFSNTFQNCQSLEKITLNNNIQASDLDTSTFKCGINNGRNFPMSNPDQNNYQITEIYGASDSVKNYDWQGNYRRSSIFKSNKVLYIADRGRYLSFNPVSTPDNNSVFMKHENSFIGFKLVLPTDPLASNVYVAHRGRWLCLANT